MRRKRASGRCRLCKVDSVKQPIKTSLYKKAAACKFYLSLAAFLWLIKVKILFEYDNKDVLLLSA